jgi:glutathionylspermidine synthase
MVDKDDPFLSAEERNVIIKTLPYTTIFSSERLEELLKNRDKYVVKAVFGRYSEEVYIGKMHSDEEWKETLQYVTESDKFHIIQEFCPIKREKVLKYNGFSYGEIDAFGNLGIYLVDGEFAGVSLRLSSDYLSLDDIVWINSVGIRDYSFKLRKYTEKDRAKKWIQINDKAAFEHGYTGGYTGSYESFSLDALLLDKAVFHELKAATEQISYVFKKVTEYVRANNTLICPILGIHGELIDLTVQNYANVLSFVGRMDWVLDSKGCLKLLEFNSETPAGLMESTVLNEYIQRELGIEDKNPNTEMKQMIRECFLKIIGDYKKHLDIENIGIVTSSYSEDWFNTTIIYDQLKNTCFNIQIGEISGLSAKKGKLQLYGTQIEAVYRYYPLDWLDKDDYFAGVIDGLKYNSLSINPPSTLISQSKAFFALVYELMYKGFFNEEENELIKRYIPRTALLPHKSFEGFYCAKPYFGREGAEVAFSFKETFAMPKEEDFIFQEWIDIQPVSLDIHTISSVKQEIAYPILGTYVIGDKFGGIYTRAGGSITNKWAIYLPTYVEK